jgi:hypothetical protein
MLAALAKARPQLFQEETQKRLGNRAGKMLTGEGITGAIRAASLRPIMKK